ncbi:MAG TPA: hypothetical protein VGW98_00730 [Solirubrobacteraceae bacterium]|nr:hypothetical protein [Solirubrobacteraceae bacterium]
MTATSDARRLMGVVAGVSLVGAAAILLLSWAPSSSDSRVVKAGTQASRPANAFSWLRPRAAPAGWAGTSIASGAAVLFHPPGWRAIPGDKGTVSFSLRDGRGLYRGYLNVTPRQGAERLAGWAGFRINRNRAEGDRQVREQAAAEGLHFAAASGSCVIDAYLSRVASNPYTELACIASGRKYTNVFIGAALSRDWQELGPMIERAASALIER